MLRRTIGITATAAAISIAAILPAGAQAPSGATYSAGAKATAVDLSVFGQALAVSETASGVDSTPKAVADGHALITPAGNSAGAPVTSTGDEATGEDCKALALPTPINLAALELVCVRTKAAVASGNPASSATSDEVVIEITSPDLIAGTPLAGVVGQIQGGVDQLFAGLAPVLGPVTAGTGVNLPGVVDSLLGQIQAGQLLARITIAPTSSTSQADASNVGATATSNGVIVELLPNLPGGALAVVTVGSSTSAVTRGLSGASPTTSGSAAVINVTYPNGQLAGLDALTGPLTAALNTAFDQLACGNANPLSPVICFTLGSSKTLDAAAAKAIGFDFGSTTVGRESSVLGLTLLSAAGNGGITLNVGHTAVAAGATPAPPLPGGCAPPCDDPLPRTGGDTMLPLT
ncbi:MAG: hypothetical protein ABIY48_05500, partial [Acidimicrobiales bacterium]